MTDWPLLLAFLLSLLKLLYKVLSLQMPTKTGARAMVEATETKLCPCRIAVNAANLLLLSVESDLQEDDTWYIDLPSAARRR